ESAESKAPSGAAAWRIAGVDGKAKSGQRYRSACARVYHFDGCSHRGSNFGSTKRNHHRGAALDSARRAHEAQEGACGSPLLSCNAALELGQSELSVSEPVSP